MAPLSSQAPEENNPYAAPSAEVGQPEGNLQLHLASLPERFFATLLDRVMMAPMLVFIVQFGVGNEETGAASETTIMVAVSLLLGLLMVNLVLLLRNGQTIGKVILRTRIVDRDGRPASFSKLILMRGMINGIIATYVPIYLLLDPLLIFRADRRCIHDHLAGTLVIQA